MSEFRFRVVSGRRKGRGEVLPASSDDPQNVETFWDGEWWPLGILGVVTSNVAGGWQDRYRQHCYEVAMLLVGAPDCAKRAERAEAECAALTERAERAEQEVAYLALALDRIVEEEYENGGLETVQKEFTRLRRIEVEARERKAVKKAHDA